MGIDRFIHSQKVRPLVMVKHHQKTVSQTCAICNEGCGPGPDLGTTRAKQQAQRALHLSRGDELDGHQRYHALTAVFVSGSFSYNEKYLKSYCDKLSYGTKNHTRTFLPLFKWL